MEEDSTQRLIVLSLSSLLSVPTHTLPPDALSNIQNVFQQVIRELVFIEEEKEKQDSKEEGDDDDDEDDDDGNCYCYRHCYDFKFIIVLTIIVTFV